MREYCSQLNNIPKEGETIHNSNLYMCRITDDRCIASSYADADPGHQCSQLEAHYDDSKAVFCPGYDLPNKLAEKVRLGRIQVKIKSVKEEIKKLRSKL